MTGPACSACGAPTRSAGPLFRCDRCRSARVWPLPDVTAIYDADYFDGADDARGYFDPERMRAWKASTAALLLRRIRPHVSAAAPAVLDFGAGAGDLVRACLERDLAVTAVEPNARGRELIRAAGINPAADLDGIDRSARFDLIVLSDVIEHVEEPRATLSALTAHLAAGGVIAVTTPDFGGPWRRLLRSRWPHLKPREHLHYLTRAGARALVRRAGLEWVAAHAHVKVIGIDYVLSDQRRRGGVAGKLAGALAPVVRALLPLPVPAYLDEMLVIARRPPSPSPTRTSARPASRKPAG